MSEFNGPRVCVDKIKNIPAGMAERLAAEKGKLWANPELRVGFFNGDGDLQARVMEAANEWTQHAHVRFALGAPVRACDIRIIFGADPGSWSYVGTEAKSIDPSKPTMNFGWLTPGSTMDDIRPVVLHEFGHALGCVHEHSRPDSPIPWNKPAVYDYYWNTQGWTKEDVDEQVFFQYDEDLTVHPVFDETSIMCYPVDARLTLGGFSIPFNRVLSPTDIKFIGELYPRPATP